MRVLVVDDEPYARSNLKVLLDADPDVSWIGECAGGAQALSEVRREAPDIMFLDVQMPEVDGFTVLESLGREAPVTVFVTAFDAHALRAFDAGALDYLLKPYDDARFQRALNRAKERLAQRPKEFPPLAIRSTGRTTFLPQDAIEWVEAADYYACVHAHGKSHLLRRSMKELERELDGGRFCRVHRSAIVNLASVRAVQSLDDEGEVLLHSGVRVPLSRRYRGELKARLARRG